MIILSLFGGIECGRVAIDRLGIPVDKYFSSEIDPYAIKITKANYPDIIHIGDVKNIFINEFWGDCKNDDLITGEKYTHINKDLKIDLLIGGSPCQDLSSAKKNGKGLDGEKSSLFYEYLRILGETQPKYFLLENVASMKQSEKEKITQALQAIYPDTDIHMINSTLVSAQNRKRFYWTNIPGVTQPSDKKIILRDILEDIPMDDPRWKPLDEKYLNDKAKLRLREKSLSITASYHKKTPKNYFEKGEGQIVVGIIQKPHGKNEGGIVQDGEKAPTITSSKYQDNNFVLCIGNTHPSGRGMNGNIYHIDGKAPTLTTNKGEGIKISDGFYYRKLTPLECERLQTLPDGYTAHVSDSRRYKAIGNGWTVDVIAHILSFIK